MELKVRLIGGIQLILSWIVWPYYIFLSFTKQPKLPQMKSHLLEMPAVELARKIRNKEITSRSVVSAYIQRIQDVNPLLNAVVEERFNEALEDADIVDHFIATTNKDPACIERESPLLGIPVTVKESIGMKGLSQSVGSLLRKGAKASEDGASVVNVKKAGGIPIAITNTPEYCLSWETSNNLTGTTNNPYDLTRSSGGSSGGEGALLGSGASVVGLASDIAGSIRIPAMFNGVYGHKPSSGIVSTERHFPNSSDENFQKFLVCGPMTRYVEDLKPMLKIMAGENAEQLRLDEEVGLDKLDVYYQETAGFSLVAVPVDWEIRKGIREAAEFLNKSYNCNVQKITIEELQDSVEISASVFLGMKGIPDILENLPKDEKAKTNLNKEIMKCCLGKSRFSINALLFLVLQQHNLFIPREKYPDYCDQNEKLKQKFNKLLGENGVFIYPTFPIPALHHLESITRISGILYTMIFNTLCLPATNVPIGLDRHGVPIGIQVVAGEKQDRLCLAVAKALDKKFGGWVPPSGCK